LPPELKWKNPSSDARLQIEPDQRQNRCYLPCMFNQRGNRQVTEPTQAKKSCIVTKKIRQFGFLHRLAGVSADSGDSDDSGVCCLVGSKFEYRAKKANAGGANLKLGCVDSYGNTTGTRGQIVTRKCSLMTLVQFAVLG